MDRNAISAISDLLAAVAVVATLFYLALQVRQNTTQSKLGSSEALDASINEAFNPIYIPENFAVWAKGHVELDSLSKSEVVLFDMLMSRMLGCMVNATLHYEKGAIDYQHFENNIGY